MREKPLESIRRKLREMLRRRYLPAPWSFEDVLQQVHLHLLLILGENFLEKIEERTNESQTALKRAVARGIGSARWTWEKRRQRGIPEVVFSSELFAPAEEESPLVASLREAIDSLDAHDKLLIDLKRAGFSVNEILAETDMNRTEFYRRFARIKSQLKSALSSEMT